MTHEPVQRSVGQINPLSRMLPHPSLSIAGLDSPLRRPARPDGRVITQRQLWQMVCAWSSTAENSAAQWNPGLKRHAGCGGFVIFVMVPSRNGVDDLFAKMRSNGSPVQKAPEDAFWGARYAIVEDPDGNSVGIMSPTDQARRFVPPPPLRE